MINLTENQVSKTRQLKVVFPEHLYEALSTEAEVAAVTMADLIRLAVADRYKRKHGRAELETAAAPSPTNGKENSSSPESLS